MESLLLLGFSWKAWAVAGALGLAGAGFLVFRLRLIGVLIVLAAPVAAVLIVAVVIYLMIVNHKSGDIGPVYPPEVGYVLFLAPALLCVPLGLAAIAGGVLVHDVVRERGPFAPPRRPSASSDGPILPTVPAGGATAEAAVLPTVLAGDPPAAPPGRRP